MFASGAHNEEERVKRVGVGSAHAKLTRLTHVGHVTKDSSSRNKLHWQSGRKLGSHGLPGEQAVPLFHLSVC